MSRARFKENPGLEAENARVDEEYVVIKALMRARRRSVSR